MNTVATDCLAIIWSHSGPWQIALWIEMRLAMMVSPADRRIVLDGNADPTGISILERTCFPL